MTVQAPDPRAWSQSMCPHPPPAHVRLAISLRTTLRAILFASSLLRFLRTM